MGLKISTKKTNNPRGKRLKTGASCCMLKPKQRRDKHPNNTYNFGDNVSLFNKIGTKLLGIT
jgi:hypothetical protein